jgi:hypothetical protein
VENPESVPPVARLIGGAPDADGPAAGESLGRHQQHRTEATAEVEEPLVSIELKLIEHGQRFAVHVVGHRDAEKVEHRGADIYLPRVFGSDFAVAKQHAGHAARRRPSGNRFLPANHRLSTAASRSMIPCAGDRLDRVGHKTKMLLADGLTTAPTSANHDLLPEDAPAIPSNRAEREQSRRRWRRSLGRAGNDADGEFGRRRAPPPCG